MNCDKCGTKLNWREAREGRCGECAGNQGAAPYPFCLHPKRCAGLGSCPRDYSCCE